MVKANRILAITYALFLGIAETSMNWGNWQYAPLWIVDYFVVAWLLYGGLVKDSKKSSLTLIGGWSFSLAMMYMAIAIMTDPENANGQEIPSEILISIMLFISISIAGLILSYRGSKDV